jgi:hypothetical protein
MAAVNRSRASDLKVDAFTAHPLRF